MDYYKLQNTTLWSFPKRGNWSTHKGDYRGNWSPHIPKNLILKYTKPKDIVLEMIIPRLIQFNDFKRIAA